LTIVTQAISGQAIRGSGRAIRFFAAERAVFVVGAYDSNHQICQIFFGKKDGSIFISSVLRIWSELSQAHRLALALTPFLNEGGKVTSHLVKFSHHPDGRVHFSQTGKVRTEIIRTSFPLPRRSACL
jgi:hypothetical protein